MRHPRHSRRRQRGQATAEFAVALVLFMSAVIGFLQLGALSFAHIRVAHEARSEADRDLDSGGLPSAQPTYSTWRNGTDGLAFTGDDQAVIGTGDFDLYASELQVDALALEQITPDFYLVPNHMSSPLAAVSIPLYQGEGRETVPIDPTFQRLFFVERSSLNLRDHASMPSLQIDDY